MLLPRSLHPRSGALLVSLGLALVLALAGCGSSDTKKPAAGKDATASSSAAPTSCEDVESGTASESVKVAGAFGKKQTATFDAPLKADSLQRTVLTKGSGAVPKAGDTLDILLDVYSGKSGKSLGSQKASLSVGDARIPDAFRAGFDCVPVGSRSVVTASAKTVYGDQGNPSAGISADDSLVIVTDVVRKEPELKPAAWKTNPPKVTFDKSGKPTMKLPGKKPASTLMMKVLRQGTGAVVTKTSSVTIDYQGTSWNTGKIFDQSYGKPAQPHAANGFVPGFSAALYGQKVGTRLVVTIPPKDGYGPAASSENPLGGQTLVFVVEIKAVTGS